MASLSQIRSALQAVGAAISGVTAAYDVMPSKPEFPAIGVSLKSIEYSQDFDGAVKYGFYLWLYVSPTDLERAQRAMDPFLAPSGVQSVKAAFDADPSLNHLVSYAVVTGVTQGPSMENVAGSQALAIPIEIEVMT